MGDNIPDIHSGGVSIHKDIKHFRKLKKNISGGVTTYVMIMMGMIFILYLFGFTNIWTAYQKTTVGEDVKITNPELARGVGIIDMLIKTLTDPKNLAIIGGGVFVITVALGWLTKTTQTVLQFLLPIILLVALNIFVFPIGHLQTDLSFAASFGATTFLFIFFNAFYILSVLEFIRGNA